MPLRKGQKLTSNPRSVRLEIRLTKDESKLLTETAEALNDTKTGVIVKGVQLLSESLKEK